MGVNYCTCVLCEKPLTMYSGSFMSGCKCEEWICYDCIDSDDKFRDDEYELADAEECCYCEQENVVLKKEMENRDALLEYLNSIKLSKKKRDKIIELSKL